MKKKRFIVPLLLLAMLFVPYLAGGQQNPPRDYTKANQQFARGQYREAIRTYQAKLHAPEDGRLTPQQIDDLLGTH